MPLYGFLIAAATASGFPFAGGGSLMGAQYPAAHAHPGAVVWAPRYVLVSSFNRRWPSPEIHIETTALDPGRGALAASVGARYHYEGTEQHLVGGALDLGLRLGGGLSLGVAGAYEPDVDWTDTLRVGLSYGTWLRRTQAGLEPAVIASVDWDPAQGGNGRWRTGLLVTPIDGLKTAWDHRFDGSNLYALAYRIGRVELQTSGGFLGDYSLDHYGVGVRFYDREGWLGASWSTQNLVRHIALEVTIPIGANLSR